MTKQLIIGLATLSVAGAVLLGSGMYAASTGTISTKMSNARMEQRDPTQMLATLKTLVKYPELKATMPQGGGMKGGMMGKRGGVNPMDTILSGVTAADKTAIEAIHTEYRTKQDALRTEEKAKVDAIIAKYPELKAKLDTLEASRPQMGEGRGGMMGGRGNHGAPTASGAIAQ